MVEKLISPTTRSLLMTVCLASLINGCIDSDASLPIQKQESRETADSIGPDNWDSAIQRRQVEHAFGRIEKQMIERLRLRIAYLKTKKPAAEEARIQLRKFVVENPFVVASRQQFGFTILNHTDRSIRSYLAEINISSAKTGQVFHATMHQAAIASNLDPGQTRNVRYMDHAIPLDQGALVVSIQIVQVAGHDDQPIWDATQYSDQMLESLEDDLATLQRKANIRSR